MSAFEIHRVVTCIRRLFLFSSDGQLLLYFRLNNIILITQNAQGMKIQHLGQHTAPPPTSSHSFPSAFKPVTGSFATYIWVEHLGRVNRAKTQTGGDEAGDAAQV